MGGACGAPGTFPGLGRGDLCEDHALYHGRDHADLGNGHLADAAGGNENAGRVLPAREAGAIGWGPVAKVSGMEEITQDLGKNLLSWVIGCVFVYAALFGIGQLCFGRLASGFVLGLVSLTCGVALYRLMPKPTEWRV
jgi:hypothetical protein